MAGGEHRPGTIQQARREIELIGGGEPDPDDVKSLCGHPVGE